MTGPLPGEQRNRLGATIREALPEYGDNYSGKLPPALLALDALLAEAGHAAVLRTALDGYHALAGVVAECVNDCGEQLLYSEWHRANQRAEAALAAAAEGRDET